MSTSCALHSCMGQSCATHWNATTFCRSVHTVEHGSATSTLTFWITSHTDVPYCRLTHLDANGATRMDFPGGLEAFLWLTNRWSLWYYSAWGTCSSSQSQNYMVVFKTGPYRLLKFLASLIQLRPKLILLPAPTCYLKTHVPPS